MFLLLHLAISPLFTDLAIICVLNIGRTDALASLAIVKLPQERSAAS